MSKPTNKLQRSYDAGREIGRKDVALEIRKIVAEAPDMGSAIIRIGEYSAKVLKLSTTKEAQA